MINDFREVIGAIQSEMKFEVAIAELEASGIDRVQISVVAQEEIARSPRPSAVTSPTCLVLKLK